MWVVFDIETLLVLVKEAHLSLVRIQYDWIFQGLQSKPTDGFHVWKSSGLILNISLTYSQVSSPTLSIQSIQLEIVSGSHCS